MLYKNLGKTPYVVSQIGVGCRGLLGHDLEGMTKAIDIMEELGINFLDLYSPNPDFRSYMGRALVNRRNKFIIQAHIGSIWENSCYTNSRNVTEVEKGFSDQLKAMATGHVEIGLIHNVESPEDLDRVLNGDVMRFARRLKEFGTIGAIGISVSDVETAILAAKSGAVETIMFGANIYLDHNCSQGKAEGKLCENRNELYSYCAENGIGLSLMNVFGDGDLLKEDKTPLEGALTVNQCLSYALNTPGAAAAICSALDFDQLRAACAYTELTDKEKAEIQESLKGVE